MAVTPWLLVVLAGAHREAKCRDAGNGEGLDPPTSSASSFSPSWGGLYSEVHTILRSFALDKHRDSCFGGLLAASCEVPLPFSRHWIFPSLEDQCKIDPRSRAASSSPRCAYSSTFPCSSALVGPLEIFGKILRKSQEFCFPGFAKTFLLIEQPKEMRIFSLTLRVGSTLNFKKGFANAILQNTQVLSPILLKYKF